MAASGSRDGILKNAGFALTVSLVGAVFTAVLTIFLLRQLGPADYGVFALAMSVGALVQLPSDFGITHSTSRFVAESLDDRPAVRGIVSDALRLKLVISGVCAIVMIALAGPIADGYDTQALVWPIRILALAVLGQSVLQLYDQILEAEGKISVYLRVIAVESFFETAGSIGLVLGGFGVSGAMAGRAGGYLFAAGFGFVLLARALGFRPSLWGRSAGNYRRIAGYGSALLLVDGAFTLFTQIDVLMIGTIISVTAGGQFAAPMRLITFLGYAGAAAAAAVTPRVAQGANGPDTRAFHLALRRLLALQGLFMAPLVVWAEPITRLALGADYASSAAVMRGLAPYVLLIGISPVLARGVNYLGEARRRIPIAIAALLVNLGIDLVLLSRIGIVGGAVGTDVAYALYVGAHLWICTRMLGIDIRALGRTFIRVALAAALAALPLLALGTGDVAFVRLVVGGVLTVLVYAGVLRLLGELSADDVRMARTRVASLLSRG